MAEAKGFAGGERGRVRADELLAHEGGEVRLEQRPLDDGRECADRGTMEDLPLHRAELQCPDRCLGTRAGVGADDDDGERRFRHDVADRAQAVELRHLEIERHDVGLVLVDFADGVEPVARRGHHAELAVVRSAAAQDVDEHAPHQGAVVGHDDRRPRIR